MRPDSPFEGGVFRQLTILAPGLLGASVAKAARARGAAQSITVWSRRPETRLKLQELPWCDEVCETPEAACRSADLVVICAPVEKIAPLAAQAGAALPAGAIVTDVGSVKGEICRKAQAAMPERARFVGSHPMAGSEKSGLEHADENLFQNRPCFVTPLEDSDPKAVARVVAFWDELGAEVATVDPDRHDEIVAHISHLPHLLASCLCSYLSKQEAGWRNFAGPGLRDATRIASGDPNLWKEILTQNRDEMLRALRRMQDELQACQAALANRDDFELMNLLKRGKAYRDQFTP